ncbi:ABC transporter substrate-binding protein [Microbacterium nymphoidis]|uniref:ABC transporter substrate-binding protein n=1 Tax=Microbacterium nymphoidis TaxID=2898586 RepID=UPI001E2E96E6|nr:ABC transporter substrate-binding protein [Microbacterium nymphoidis]MCD2497100.1 ABC transporter substrate-binding protein [Microbacterium nymphoidis]
MNLTRRFALAALTAAALALAGCASSDPLGGSSSTAGSDPSGSAAPSGAIVVGSQAYYSNEIIAEIYAQALEGAGNTVERKFNIGQRDAYMPALESGEVTLFPEYTGNLLQWLDKDTTATGDDDVYAALQAAMPDSLTVLDQAPATDQDSYTVTAAFAAEHGLSSIEDLAKVPNLTLGGPPELQERPYGPTGLKSIYGVDVTFSPTADTTVDELVAGGIQVGNVYTADPRIATDDLVALKDTKNIFLASHVVPVVNKDVADKVADTINAVSAKLTADALRELNKESTVDQKSAPDIAKAWLTDQGLAG